MVLKYYYDLMSQPSRALYILLKINNIPFQGYQVNLRDAEHLSTEFKESLSRFQKVPFIHDNDFILAESIAILRYLSREHNLNDQWYPKDSRLQAIIDEYLEWQHNNTRIHCATYFWQKWLIPKMTGSPMDQKIIDRTEKLMRRALDDIENLWLRDGRYICGDILTAADIFAACEIEQTRMAGFDPTADYPKLSKWLQTVRKELDPLYSEAHKIVNKIANYDQVASKL